LCINPAAAAAWRIKVLWKSRKREKKYNNTQQHRTQSSCWTKGGSRKNCGEQGLRKNTSFSRQGAVCMLLECINIVHESSRSLEDQEEH
jgi:hypothetical protein